MKIFSPPNSHIHTIVRAFVTRGDKVVLCRPKNESWFFLPGGHVEDGESLTKALVRELSEEFGKKSFSEPRFIGFCENIFELKENHIQHELNVVFHVQLTGNEEIVSNEDHLEFFSIDKKDLESLPILPLKLKLSLVNWLRTGTTFFTGL
jgi:ADP-ribose pyrophosphatase YjhB (NUDIX family)